MIRIYGRLIREWEIEVIVPIPLHRKKKRFRGYNQAEIVAKHLGEMMGIPVDSRSVIRSRYTRPQKELNDKERKQNLKHAFQLQVNGRTTKRCWSLTIFIRQEAQLIQWQRN